VVVQDPSSVDDETDPNTYVLVTGAMPVQDVLSLRIASLYGGVTTLEVLDVQGRSILVQNLGQLSAGVTDVQVPVSACAPGAYNVRAVVGTSILRTSFVVK
jgi:hypothetical protein